MVYLHVAQPSARSVFSPLDSLYGQGGWLRGTKWLGGQTGMIAVLHTWGQTMSLHPHLHCIVPGGGITAKNKWKTAKSQGKYLIPVKAMGKVFQARCITALKSALPDRVPYELIHELYKRKWVVYAKRPYNGPQSVIEYSGRYTHKIAISNHRITHITAGKVAIKYKDYRQSAAVKEMELDRLEFIRPFAMHILPKGFVRIRHYGILSSTAKAKCAALIKNHKQTENYINTMMTTTTNFKKWYPAAF